MLTKTMPATIPALLKVKTQGVEITLGLTFHNRTPDDFDAFIGNQENLKAPDGVTNEGEMLRHSNASVALYTIKSFDDGTNDAFPLTRDGLIEMDRHYPGILYALHKAYHQARGAAVEKN